LTWRPPDLARRAARALLLALACLACTRAGQIAAPAGAAAAAPITLRVMTFNVEYGGRGVDFAKVIEAIEVARPDIVALEEPEANTREIAAALGWPYADPRADVISRFPILDPPGGDGRFVWVEVRPGGVVAIANVHLPSDPYGPYWIAEGRSVGEVLALERRVRLSQLQPVLDALAGLRGAPVFLLGDFNAPSHLDWTRAAAAGRPHASEVAWPVSVAVEQAGFVDSYRAVHPDPVGKPGHTWWAARPPVGDDFTGHPRDRIDLVYAAGPVEAVASQIVGEAGARDVDLHVTPWPSDHRAVVSTFRAAPAPMPRLVAVGERLVDIGDPLEVEFHDPAGEGRRIALVAPGAADIGSAASAPATASEVAPGRGSLELPTRDLAPGPYEVVLLSAGDAILSRTPVRVKAPGDSTQVGVDRAVYAPGEAIAVRWINGPGNRWDWIGILPDAADAAATGSYPVWRHTGTRIDGDLVIDADGAQDQPWPLPPGGYRVLYLLNDTTSPAAQARFEIREAPAVGTGVLAVARAPYAPDSGSLSVRCGRLFDGIADRLRESVTVSIERGRIVAVGDDSVLPATAPVLDLPDRTCLPGLIDMHTHLSDRPGDTADLRVYYRRSLAEQVALGRDNARATLLAGFTSVRDVGTYIAWSDRALRDEIARGEIIGPRMQVSGFYLTIPGGGGDLVIPGVPEQEIPAQVRTGVARGPEAFRRKAQLAVAGGADVLKVIASGAVLAYGGVPGSPEMTPEELRAVVLVAHAAGRKVAAHAHGALSIEQAILAGADTIEHASLIDDEAIALAREHGVALSMDVYNGSYIETEGRRQGWPEEFLRKNLETTEAQRDGFSRAHRAGVAIVYGTDSAVYPHGWNARQLEVMVARGMTPAQALRSATSLAAHAMGWSDRVGSLQVGRYGDLIAVAGDPLSDVRLLQQVDVVIKGGLPFVLPAD
jgi:imidazolonepropionase-like amidohydrolase/endonuclease/exonuclease/phosphatase family metal-dependent hydrolase